MPRSRAIGFVASIEAAKGVVVLLAATGLLALVHRDVHEIAATLIEHMHLNPASKYPRIFLDAASHVHDGRLLWIAIGAGTYATVRLVEAYGLFRERKWAEVLAAASGAIYVPFELVELIRHPAWDVLAILMLNILVVAIMVRALFLRRRADVGKNAG
jgi:uncharacterized membrane protein (DUF2068 family)